MKRENENISVITLVMEAIPIGIVSGTAIVLYRKMLAYIDIIRTLTFSDIDITKAILILISAAAIGLLISLIIKVLPESGGSGVPLVLAEANDKADMSPWKVIVGKFLGGGLSNLSGLSLGLEGPSIQIGAVMGKAVGFLSPNGMNKRWRLTAGAAAGMSAAFGAPITGVIFALEEMHGYFSPVLIVPCMISASIADIISKLIFGLEPVFTFKLIDRLPFNQYIWVICFAAFIGLIGVIFNHLSIIMMDLFDKLKIPSFIKPIVACIIAVISGFYFYQLLGGGHHLLSHLPYENLSVLTIIVLLVGKIILTTIASASGAHGGIFIPILCIGGLGGALFANVLISFGLIDPNLLINFIFLGMVGIIAGVIRSPLLAIVMVTEITSSFTYVLAFTIVSVVSYVAAELTSCKPLYVALMERSGLSH
ncbi:MAG: ClC family H(+)/Cl(-) exchange transporter [Tissierellia bacterium]|nr:ClC family H(+)/Cl(-) exchange transporter [Tissierellia bacterium]